jgi:hypothetical protein
MRGNATAKNYLTQNTVITMTEKAFLELNMNRYATQSTVSDSVYGTDTKYQNYYKDKFPLTSVVLPNRPVAGIVKPRFGKYNVTWPSSGTMNNISKSAVYDSAEDWWKFKARLYFAGPDDKYKYFSSHIKMPVVTVSYDAAVWANKVRVTFENTFDYPTAYTIEINRVVGGWLTIGTNVAIPTTGRVEIHRSGGVWSTTAPVSPQLTDAIEITAIRVTATAMNRSDAYLSIIEISPRIVVDVTQYLQSYDADEEISADDVIAPVGVASANVGGVVFSNTGNEFEPRLGGAGLTLGDVAKRFARVRIYNYIASQQIPMMDMLVDRWQIKEGETAEAETFDDAVTLQNISCPDMVQINVTPITAVLRLLDRVGFNNVRVHLSSATENQPKLGYFYTTNDQTVWDAIQELFQVYQYAAYFDSRGNLHLASNEWMFERSTPTWTFRATPSGADKPDIMSHSEEMEEPVNKATVTFTPIGISSSNDPGKKYGPNVVSNNRVATRILYSPERGVLLGAALSSGTVTSGALPTKTIDGQTVSCFPIVNTALNDQAWGAFSGHFLVDQEIMKFNGLEYSYSDGTVTKTRVVRDSKELSEVYSEAVGKVSFTGNLCNVERAQFGTLAADHGFTKASWSIPASQDKYVSAQTDSTNANRYLLMHNTVASSTGRTTAFKNPGTSTNTYRTRLKILKSGTQARAGIIVSATKNGSNVITSGYLITINAVGGKTTKELQISRIGGTGTASVFTSDANIKYDEWETITVTTRMNSQGYDYITLTGYGFTLRTKFPSKKIPYTNSLALVTIGRTKAAFDWVSTGGGEVEATNDQRDAFNNILKESMGLLSSTPGYYESFGDLCREIFVDTVRFSKGPALNINIHPTVNALISNTSPTKMVAKTTDIAWAVGRPTAWTARIAVANISSRPLLLDELESGLYPMLYGNIVEEFTEIEVTEKNAAAISKYGENKIEVNSRWVNDRPTASRLATWLVDQAERRERHEIECFDNPLVEIGDIVTIDYSEKGLTGTDRYVVKSVSRGRSEEGLDTSVSVMKL